MRRDQADAIARITVPARLRSWERQRRLRELYKRRVAFHEAEGHPRNEAEAQATFDVYGGDVADEKGKPVPDHRIPEARRITGDNEGEVRPTSDRE
jgi:hypothetical protein